jgi:PAS domain S-box-containing protein
VNNLPLSLLVKDASGRRVFANRRYLEFRQLSLEEVLGKTDSELFPEGLALRFTEDDVRVLRTGEVLHDLEEHLAPDGTTRWVERFKGPLRDAEGRIVGVQVHFWDVTDRHRVEQELERERYLLQSLMESLPDAIYFKDLNSRFLRISRALADRFRLDSASDAIGKTDADIFTAEHARAALADEHEIIRTGRPMVARVERETWPDRDDTWVSSTKAPLLDNEGHVVGTFGISRDITELKHTQEELRRARDAADAASRAKSEFLANMSHEIRTPLNAVIGLTELLLDTDLTDTQQEYLQMVQNSGESLLELLNDVLDFSKIEAGKIELAHAPFNVRDRISDTMKSLAVRAHNKGLELNCAIDPNVPIRLVGDANRLRQIIVNLVDNAVKFTDEGEVLVDVRCEAVSRDQAKLQVSVEDTGIGVPADKQEQIFEMFQQADSSSSRSYGGTGLGLAIASRLVELMSGRFGMTSVPGHGSTFCFTATFHIAHDVAAAAPDRSEDFAGRRILVVDDNATNRKTLTDMLTVWGVTPAAAANAREGFDRLAAGARGGDPFEVVLLDIDMPKVDGVELASWIREDKELKGTPLIMLTSSNRPIDFELRPTLGIAGSLLKPVKHSELFELLTKVLNASTTKSENVNRTETARAARLCGVNVLLAEDNVVNQKLSIAVLEKLGCRVTLAPDGREAVAACGDGQFDVILMDVQMPTMDGYEATRKIRQLEAKTGRHTPIIALTAHALRSDRAACLESGMDDYLPKPVRVNELANKLAAVMSRHDACVAAERHSEGVVHWKEALEALGGDLDLLRIAVDTFLEEADSLLQDVRRSVELSDAQSLTNSAHLLKGELLSIGARRAANVAEDLECLSRSNDFDSSEEVMVTLQHELERLVPALQQGPPWPGGRPPECCESAVSRKCSGRLYRYS